MTKIHRGVRRFCAILIGIVFFVSGSLKLIDPVGAKLLVDEYLNFFHLGFLKFLSMPLGVFFPVAESVVGAALITGIWRKATAYATMALVGFFTLITLILWIFNPAMDCGCFGEAIHLTHFQSLLKNLILCGLCAVAFFPFRDFGPGKRFKKISFGLVVGGVAFMCIYSLIFIPCLDFTPYEVGSTLLAESEELMDDDPVVVKFIYEKNGHEGAFTINKLPDSTWTYVRTETEQQQKLGRRADEFPSLAFRDAAGSDMDSLAADGSVMVFSVYDPSKLKLRRWTELGKAMTNASQAGFTTLLLAAASPDEFEAMVPKEMDTAFRMQILMSVYYSDYKSLISLNRSNGGAVYFNDGDLIEKWSRNAYPSLHDFQKLYDSNYTAVMIQTSTKGRMTFQAYLLYSFAIMILL